MEEGSLGLLAYPSPPSRWRLRDERPLSPGSPVCPRGSGRSGAGAVWGHPWSTRRRFEGTSHPPLVRWISWKRSLSYPVRLSVWIPPHAWFFCRSWLGFSSSNSMGGGSWCGFPLGQVGRLRMRPPPPNRGLRDRRSFPTQNPQDRPLESGRTRCGCRGGCREGRDQGVPPPMALEERHQNHRANHTSRLRTPRHKDRPQTTWNAPRSRQPPRGSEWHASETGIAPDPREFEVVRGREGRQDRNAPPPPTWRFQGSRDASRRSRA